MTDQPELFTVPRNETRLEKFKRENGVETQYCQDDEFPWWAFSIERINAKLKDCGRDQVANFGELLVCSLEFAERMHMIGMHDTEESACLALARQLGLSLTL